jgi:energy-coupling factor transport system substrate-specific component
MSARQGDAAFDKAGSKALKVSLALLMAAVIAVLLIWKLAFIHQNWEVFAAVLLLASLAAFFVSFERNNVSSKDIGVIAVLAALAAVCRVPFAPLPGIQPTTFLVIVSGYVFGARSGFMVGAVAALVSNFFLGQGPWTPFQMLFWGLIGASAGLLGEIRPQAGRAVMVPFSIAWGYLFGWLMNIFFVVFFIKPLTWKAVFVAYAASFPFDTLHALGNVCFYLLLGPQVIKVLKRFKEKMTYVEI